MRHLKFKFFVLFALGCVFISYPQMVSGSALGNSSEGQVSENNTDAPAYVQGRIIVKFKSDGDYAILKDVENIIQNNTSFETATKKEGDSLERLKK